MTQNEIFETMAQAVADKYESRAVAQFHGEHEGETLLVDFANDDGTDFEGEHVCVWALQRAIYHGEQYKGTEELDYGTFNTYHAALSFLETIFDGKEVSFYVEGF